MQVKQWQCNYKWRDFHCVFMFVSVWLWQLVLLNANGGVRRLAGPRQRETDLWIMDELMLARAHPRTSCFLRNTAEKRTVIYLEYPKLPGPGRQGHSVISLPSRNSYLGEEYVVKMCHGLSKTIFYSFSALGIWWEKAVYHLFDIVWNVVWTWLLLAKYHKTKHDIWSHCWSLYPPILS